MIFWGGPRIRVERPEFGPTRLGGSFDRLTCLHLSDLHIRRWGRRERRLVDLVNRERPDAIFITGDMVANYAHDFSAALRTLRELRAGSGIFAVFGNAEHTLGPGRLCAEFEQALEGEGITVLNNRSAPLVVRGETLHVAGVDDPFFQFDDFDRAVRDVPPGAPAVLLAHSPDILFPRGEALVVNRLDAPPPGTTRRDWGWSESSRFSPEDGTVGFENEGRHVLRVQSRQDGVALDMILLSPDERLNAVLREGPASRIDREIPSGRLLREFPDAVLIPASAVPSGRIHGKWRIKRDPTAASGARLTDLPPRREWQYQPLVQPRDYFEAEFSAPPNVRFRIWIRMKAHRGDPRRDSVYLQFDDAVDAGGRPKFRIGRPAQAKARLAEIDVILAGHTHGGQVHIPFYGAFRTMTSLGRTYQAGTYVVGPSRLYVSRGVGWSVYPVRLFCPPEIAVFTFGSAPSAPPNREFDARSY